MNFRTLSVVIAAAGLLSACRDAQQSYIYESPPADGSAGIRLTYSAGRDRAPFWNRAGDTVYYSAEGTYPPLPRTHGVLVGIPREGGRFGYFLPHRQLGLSTPKFMSGGAISPDGKLVSYFELIEFTDTMTLVGCRMICTTNRDTAFTQVRLIRGVLRVSPLEGGFVDRDTVAVDFSGRYYDTGHSHHGLPGTWILSAYPYQRLFARTGAQPFKPSWSPDGKQVVFSDGLSLVIYNTETKQARTLAGTSDGVYPAWSPKGDWIAYTKLLRSDSTVTECNCYNTRSGAIAEAQKRTIFNEAVIGAGAIILVKPDGNQQRVLSPGDMPSWLPDGARLVFRRGDQLWRASIDGTEAKPILNTLNAEEPAVSPDGKFVAFVRSAAQTDGGDAARNLNSDVWVVPLRVQ